MKLSPNVTRPSSQGYALLVVMVVTAISLLVVSGALSWASATALMTERNNRYFRALAAAEAATEKVLASVSKDYQTYGESQVYANLANYRAMVPTSAEDPYWAAFTFDNAQGNASQTYLDRLSSWGYQELQSQYTGLRGMAATYRLISNARDLSNAEGSTAAVRQDVQVASIPVFQFAIFYSVDLEINPGAAMKVTGRVHGNNNIYTQPDGVTLTFQSHVTAAGQIHASKMPGDPGSRSPGTVVYQAEHDGGVSSLTLPIGTNNSPSAVHAVLEIPPPGEDINSPLAKQRYHNKADVVVFVNDGGVAVTSGAYNNFATAIPAAETAQFLNTSASFYSKREGKTINAAEIDVAKLRQWSLTNTTLRASLGRDLSSIYVADQRSQTATTQSGVRLINGQTLPPLGLTVATPNPLYVKGHYNAPAAHLGTTNTTATLPASLVSDAITILSGAWNDANSGSGIDSRVASNTTVNAAILGGIVKTGGGKYSGGVENFPRFLEKWSGKTLTYNGSMVVMFFSQIATAPWGGSGVYSPPSRNWTFDLNFMDATKLPPATPQLLTIIRGEWAVIPPNTTH